MYHQAVSTQSSSPFRASINPSSVVIRAAMIFLTSALLPIARTIQSTRACF
jgi:hypothetical protein